MSHYSDDLEITTPMIKLAGGIESGSLSGKENVAAYWRKALSKFPDLKFELIDVTSGVNSVALYYKSIMDKKAVEVMFLNEEGLIDALRKLSLHYEKQNEQSSTIYDNLPAEYAAKMLKAIVGFEIEVTSIDHVFKLSQNRDEKSYDNIISHLKEEGSEATAVATTMEERKAKVFKQ